MIYTFAWSYRHVLVVLGIVVLWLVALASFLAYWTGKN
jgi:hypothetical protein